MPTLASEAVVRLIWAVYRCLTGRRCGPQYRWLFSGLCAEQHQHTGEQSRHLGPLPPGQDFVVSWCPKLNAGARTHSTTTPASGSSVPLDSTSLEFLAYLQCPLYPCSHTRMPDRPSGPHLKIPLASAVLIHIHPFLFFLFLPFIACCTFGNQENHPRVTKHLLRGCLD